MQRPGRSSLALGLSFVFHFGLGLALYLMAPAGATHAGMNTTRVNTRVGAPRATHLSLWEEQQKPLEKPEAKPVEFSKSAGNSSSNQALRPPVESAPIEMPSTVMPLAPAPKPQKPASDYAAFTGGATGSSSGGIGRGSPTGHGGSRLSGGLGFFKIAEEVRSVVFVIDGSMSMGLEGSFDAARRELLASIDALSETTRFQVIVYNRNAAPLRINGHTDLVLATDANKQAASDLIRKLDPEGDTNHVRALQQAMILQPDAIFFVTDADGLRADQVHALTVFNHGRSTIHAIELNAPRRREQSPLQVLAEQNRGDFRIAKPMDK